MNPRSTQKTTPAYGILGVLAGKTMAARGLVNGRGPQHKKTSWKVGVYSCLSGRFIGVWEG